MTKRKPINPFYILLLLAGLAFSITACAYGVMTVRQLRATRVSGFTFDEDVAENGGSRDFNQLIDEYGATLMIWELVLLGLGTFGAIAYDQHLDKREAQHSLVAAPDAPPQE